MIAIYDQERITLDSVDAVFIPRNGNKKQINTAIKGQETYFPTVATYDTELQAQYVLDQIALAIEQGKTLYRMPSVEEVEKALTQSCSNCRYDEDIKAQYKKCQACQDMSMWQPKEQE
jgi:hypothetical protein